MLESTDENPLATTPNLPPVITSLEQWSKDTEPRLFRKLGQLGKRSDEMKELTAKLRAYENNRKRYNTLRSSAAASGRDPLLHWKALQAEYDAGGNALVGVANAIDDLVAGGGKVKGASESLLTEITRALPMIAAGRLQHEKAVKRLEGNGKTDRERLGGNDELPPPPPVERRSDSRGYFKEPPQSRAGSEIEANAPDPQQAPQRAGSPRRVSIGPSQGSSLSTAKVMRHNP